MKNNKIIQMSIHAMFIGLMTLMTFVPQIGFISLSPVVAFTLLHIPVLFGAVIFGWKTGLLYGLVFGFLSFTRAIVAPVSFIDFYFADPLVSILPRALFGLASGLAFDFAKLIKRNVFNKIVLSLSSAGLTLLHSVLVLLMLGLIYAPTIEASVDFAGIGFSTYWLLMGFVILTNGIPEAIIAALLVPILALALSRYPRFQAIVDAFKKEKKHEEKI
ncbi:MAG TPA: ECF transporter S component [Bacilli bacterium]|jgi:uncharacterized membrane protein|nr:ECF transporter S component [Bacilli bacterium]